MAVYFIRAGESGPVKIGKAVNVDRRLRLFQTAHHERLLLVRTIPGSFREESWLHHRFASQRLGGEWFVFSDDMMAIEVPDADNIIPFVPSRPRTQADHVIGKFGSQSALAKALGHKHSTTVQRWAESGAIPEKHWESIIEAARSANVPFSADDFVAHLKIAGDQPPNEAAA